MTTDTLNDSEKQQIKDFENELLGSEESGVSNGDVDWLFRGKAVKKLVRKRGNTLINELQHNQAQVQAQAQAQAQAKAQATQFTTTSALTEGLASVPPPTSNSASSPSISSPVTSVPLRSSLKTSSTSLNELNTQPSPPLTSTKGPPLPSNSTPANLPPKTSATATTTTNSKVTPKLSVSTSLPANTTSKPVSIPAKSPSSASHPSAFPGSTTIPVTPTSAPIGTSANRSRSSSSASKIATSPAATPLSSSPPVKKSSLFSSISSKLSSTGSRSRSSSQGQHQAASASSTTAPVSPAAPASVTSHKIATTPTTPKPLSIPSSQASSSSIKTPTQVSSAASTVASPVAATPTESKSLFGLRRKLSTKSKTVDQPPATQTQTPSTTTTTSSTTASKVPPATHTHRTHAPVAVASQKSQSDFVKEKLKVIPFKRVTFALNDLSDDPQQQIPSRRPKKGNVLVPEDLLAGPARLSIGIAGSDSVTKDEKPKVDPELIKLAMNRRSFWSAEAVRHSQEAHTAAIRIAKEVHAYRKLKTLGKDEEDDFISIADVEPSPGLEIDKPIHEHIDYFNTGDNNKGDNSGESSSDNESSESKEVSLEELYTRCCHLREILPIAPTLKQLRNKTKPLVVLKMLNPRPTFIDILSFCDFLAITPIVTVIFDNVVLDSDMIKILLISLSNSTTLEKLSLRNVPIDSTSWSYLCKFLTVNKSLIKLDISQQKVKSESTLRSKMDWELFSNCVKLRDGIEELVINGVNLSTIQFKKLVNESLVISTKRLGIASSSLDIEKFKILADWISTPGNKCTGIDVAFNDLSNGIVKPLVDVLKDKSKISNVKLLFFSLNSTNISIEDCNELVMQLSNLSSLIFLDLGNNPKLFPSILPVLREYLPKFPNLRRLHFEFNELTEASIMNLSVIFGKCPKLIHVSLLGNNNIKYGAAAALYGAVKSSNIYNLDVDYDLINDELTSKIAFYLMKNMEKSLNIDFHRSIEASSDNENNTGGEKKDKGKNNEDLIFDGSLLTKSAERLIEKKESISIEEQQIIIDALVDRTVRLRKELHKEMDKLFDKRKLGLLNIEGKETLLRYCLLDNSLESIFNIFTQEEPEEAAATASTTVPPSENNFDNISPMSSAIGSEQHASLDSSLSKPLEATSSNTSLSPTNSAGRTNSLISADEKKLQQQLYIQRQQQLQKERHSMYANQKPTISATSGSGDIIKKAPGTQINSMTQLERIKSPSNSIYSNSSTSSRPSMVHRVSSSIVSVPMHEESDDLIMTGPIVSPNHSTFTTNSIYNGNNSGDAISHNEHSIASALDNESNGRIQAYHISGSNNNTSDDAVLADVSEDEPHQVVLDSNSIVDEQTGKPVFFRRSSQTSVHNKKLEEEEGEFHRWGFFVQQQNSIMPDSPFPNQDGSRSSKLNALLPRPNTSTTSSSKINESARSVSGSTITSSSTISGNNTDGETNNSSNSDLSTPTITVNSSSGSAKPSSATPVPATSATSATSTSTHQQAKRTASQTIPSQQVTFNNIPSGPELRAAVIKAKGISSVNDLIHKINKDLTKVQKIYEGNVDESSISRSSSGTALVNGSDSNFTSSIANSPVPGSPKGASSELMSNGSPNNRNTNLRSSSPNAEEQSSNGAGSVIGPGSGNSSIIGSVGIGISRSSSVKRTGELLNENDVITHSIDDELDGDDDKNDQEEDAFEDANEDTRSINSGEGSLSESDHAIQRVEADELYDKILDEVVRVRSNRSNKSSNA
ncbi:hypothetical protein B5S29_g2886 [[Candida] boidinii]|nr:hypothetical protein B5S29_g2886 [[Candida] boidinii]